MSAATPDPDCPECDGGGEILGRPCWFCCAEKREPAVEREPSPAVTPPPEPAAALVRTPVPDWEERQWVGPEAVWA